MLLGRSDGTAEMVGERDSDGDADGLADTVGRKDTEGLLEGFSEGLLLGTCVG